MKPIHDHNQGIIPKIRAHFFNFWKREGETSNLPLSSYALVEETLNLD